MLGHHGIAVAGITNHPLGPTGGRLPGLRYKTREKMVVSVAAERRRVQFVTREKQKSEAATERRKVRYKTREKRVSYRANVR